MIITAFDTETTGLTLFRESCEHPDQPWPVSVTAVKEAPDGTFEKIYSTIVKLPPGVIIHPRAEEVHGISYQRTQDEGEDPIVVLHTLRNMFSASDVHCAYNLPFDDKVLMAMAYRCNVAPLAKLGEWLYGKSVGHCVMELARLYLKVPGTGGYGYRRVKLEQAYRRIVGVPMEGAHDATADTLAALTVFKTMLLSMASQKAS